jgi:hypothetical protein
MIPGDLRAYAKLQLAIVTIISCFLPSLSSEFEFRLAFVFDSACPGFPPTLLDWTDL